MAKYTHRKKLEDVISEEDAIEIISMESVTMLDFEAKMWAKYGRKFCEPSDRAMVRNTISYVWIVYYTSLNLFIFHVAAFRLGFWKDISLSL